MITVPEATEKIIDRSRYLTEAISKNLINLSSLARYIQPEIEEMLIKTVSEASILMALKRLSTDLKPPTHKTYFASTPDMILRSNLTVLTIANSTNAESKYEQIRKLAKTQPKAFFTLTQGLNETTLIASEALAATIKELLKAIAITEFKQLAGITVQLPKEAINTPGVFYFLLKSLAWEEINILEIVSTQTEFTLIFAEKDLSRAFTILKSIFR